MKPNDDKVTIRAVSRDEEGRKRVEKTELKTHNVDTVKYIEKKLEDKGVQRMERHPADGLGIGRPPPKSGRGGKYTWEGPDDPAQSELDGDHVFEVAKAVEDREAVARLEVDPRLKLN